MSILQVPEALLSILANDQSLHAAVLETLSTFQPVLSSVNLAFFPEYTDHGQSHVEAILLAADQLIPEASKSRLSAADVAVLTLAALCHDIGMHLSEEGFLNLVTLPSILLPNLDSKSWPELWEAYV